MSTFYPLAILSLTLTSTHASRAYPHGCLYRHPSYYTYDEREDISWARDGQFSDVEAAYDDDHVDFRKLPPKSSRLRRSYDRYRLIRRLGSGKFSDVYEAVDLEWARRDHRRVKAGGRFDGETTDCSTDTDDDVAVGDYDSLVVLKCLKPISERKIRRELLVLTHCVTLPNLARLIGVALPESMDKQEQINIETANSQNNQLEHPKKRRRKNHKAQNVDIGSITDAATAIETHKKSEKSNQQGQNIDKNNNEEYGEQLPAFILEHAGTQSQWFCHGPHTKNHDTSHYHEENYLSEQEMKYYLCHLLIALDALHSAGIMHRDVKPRNCLINLPTSIKDDSDITDSTSTVNASISQQTRLPPPPLMLVDLGLADFYLPGKEYNVRVASRHYKSPELLIGYSYYDYAIDMWSVGCMLAGLLFRREPFFRGKNNEDQLGKIVSVLGTRDFLPYVRKCNVRLSSEIRASIGKYCSVALSGEKDITSSNVARRKPWLSFLTPTCPIPSSEALDLLDKLLVYDHEQRWTAREALGHTFFDDVREDVWREVQERMIWESQWQSPIMQRR